MNAETIWVEFIYVIDGYYTIHHGPLKFNIANQSIGHYLAEKTVLPEECKG